MSEPASDPAIKIPPLIAVEEHWCSQHIRSYYTSTNQADPNSESGMAGYATKALMEFGPARLAAMDSSNIHLQIVSHAPNSIPIPPEVCTLVNDELSSLISRHPSRFRGFATLPMSSPDAAAKELDRCINEHGFLGALVDSNCGGQFYDSAAYDPLWAMATQLNVPIYIHPAPNEHTKSLLYSAREGSYPDSVADVLSMFGWGWHSETALSFLRLFAAGVFDRFPALQIVLGHQGEMLPFQLDRIEHITGRAFPACGVELKRGLRRVWNENVWVAISGVFYMAPMKCMLMQTQRERVLWAVDYPFGKGEEGVRFLTQCAEQGVLDEMGMEMIAGRNAERLFGLKTGV